MCISKLAYLCNIVMMCLSTDWKKNGECPGDEGMERLILYKAIVYEKREGNKLKQQTAYTNE